MSANLFDVEKNTHVIDFNKQDSFVDPIVANACVEVVTSKNGQGTLSHLSIGCDTQRFAQDLRRLVGEDEVPVCLAGGTFQGTESWQLVSGLIEDLTQQRFRVSRSDENSDVMGLYSRRSTVFCDRVEVERVDYQSNPPVRSVKTLFFPE